MINNSDAVLETKLDISFEEVPTVKVYSVESIDADHFGEVKVQFHWDRSLDDGRSADGFLDIITSASVLNPDGEVIAVAEPLRTTVEVRPAE